MFKYLKRIINLFRPFRYKYWIIMTADDILIARGRFNPAHFSDYSCVLLGGPFDIYEDAVKFKNEQKSL